MINIIIRKRDKIVTKFEESAFIQSPYDARIISIIKSLRQRIWHPTKKLWEIEVESIPDFLEKLKNDYVITITGENKTYIEPPKKKVSKIPSKLKEYLKTELREYQKEAVIYQLNHNEMLLADEPGAGKTLSTIASAICRKIKYKYKHVLIICGVNTIKWNWLNEIETHSTMRGKLLGSKINSKGKLVVGTSADKLEHLNHLNKDDYFIITNIETIRNKQIAEKIKKMCASGDINMVVIDESHKCCSPSSLQSKSLLKFDAECKMALTGTPVLNKPLDLWVMLNWMKIDTHSFYAFKKYYAVMGGFQNYEVVDYKHLDELEKDLNKVMLRRLKEDILDLPEKTYTNEYVEMDEHQAAIYNEVYEDIRRHIDKVELSPNPLTEMLRLRQVTSCPSIVTSMKVDCAKLNRLDELLEERIENGRKCLILSNWTSVTDELLKRYVEYNPATITGKIKDDEREYQKVKFMTNPNCKILIGTIGAMGVGLTLTAATTAIFVDEPWNYSTKLQAEDRIHRIGMQDKAEIITLITKDTIDERINQLVQDKKELSDMIVDGKVTKNKRQLIDFLMS